MYFKKIGEFLIDERKKIKRNLVDSNASSEEIGITQEELSILLGVSRQAVSSWEQGKTLPDVAKIPKLCEVLDISYNEFFAGMRKNKENKDIVDAIPLEIVLNNKEKVKRMRLGFLVVIGLLIVLFLLYYFLGTYNKVEIYKITSNGDKVKFIDALAVFTNETFYMKFTDVSSIDADIISVNLYYKEDEEKNTIYKSDNAGGIISQWKGYDEYFDMDKKDYILDNLYMDVVFESEGVREEETLDLDSIKLYSNNNLIFKKIAKIGDSIYE